MVFVLGFKTQMTFQLWEGKSGLKTKEKSAVTQKDHFFLNGLERAGPGNLLMNHTYIMRK